MAIKRGVSSYSYQNEIFDLKMYWNDFIRTIREDLDTDGVELIDETFIRDWPFLSEEFEYAWKNEIARYNMKAVTMDIYLDVLQFRDHVMNHAEAVELLKLGNFYGNLSAVIFDDRARSGYYMLCLRMIQSA